MSSADLGRHVLILTVAGSFTVAGRRLTDPVDSADKLGKLVAWAAGKHGGLQPIPGISEEPRPARVWVVGAAVALLAGAPDDTEADPGAHLGSALAPLVDDGWELRKGSGPEFILARGSGTGRVLVEVLAEQQPWLAAGETAVADDAGELGRRLGCWYSALGVLPETTGALSGAVLADRVMASRAGKRGAVVSAPGLLPSWATPEVRVQPAWAMTADQVEHEVRHSDEIVRISQMAPALASAGMLTFGYGKSEALDGDAAAAAAAAPKRAFGLWLADLPAADELTLPDTLPLPHPLMAPDHRVQAWLTTEDLDGLTNAVRDGGAGLTVEQLGITEAIVWQQKARVLEAWATRLREARETFADDPTMLALVDTAAADYLNALANPDIWTDASLRHHYQPAWAAAIATHNRMRGRRAAMRISREYHAWPVYIEGTSMIYGPAPAEDGSPVDLSDTHTRLGRLTVTARAELTGETILAMLLAESTSQVGEALADALGIDIIASDQPTGPNEQHTPATEPETTAADNHEAEPAAGEENTTAAAPDAPTHTSPEDQGPEQPDKPAGPRRTKAKPKATLGGKPAAVLDTDGLWLADGTRVELDEPITHVGQVAELAYTHNLGFPLSETFTEPGQIWLSVEVCEAVGVDVDSIDHMHPSKSLRALTAGIPFVEKALNDGWRFGGIADGEPEGLGTWTRVYREGDKRKGVWVVLTAGLGDDVAMPIFAGDPTAAQVARRLDLLAGAMRFPWKISSSATAIDLMLQARPKTWSPQDWKNVVMAPSTTEPPFNIGDVEADFNWSREPTDEERAMTFLHAYDRGGSYVAGIAGTELPIGAPTHHPQGAPFDPRVPAYHLTLIPKQGDWLQPYVLNPHGYKFTEPKWVCSPRLEQAIAMGYEPEILESYTWPQHGRVLLQWYERLRDASTILDTDDPDCQAARNQSKVVRNSGIGIIGSEPFLKGKTCYNPERRLHVMAKANSNITYRINEIGTKTGHWPLAVLKDTVFYPSNEADPDKAWPGGPKTYGRGFGQYKPERSGLLADQLKYLNGRGYQGKQELDPIDDWRRAHGLTANNEEA
ncbi:MAG: hypothetical protein EKK51_09565 [Mycolicibacterium sp.]|nr:MAG: hypothetical protein EKK51_09565 [Mycolicibacterium sp.]